VTAERLKDSKGRSIYTVYAAQLTETEVASRTSQGRADEDVILILMLNAESPPSLADIATHLKFINAKGQPLRAKVQRILDRLKKDKLITNERARRKLRPDRKGREAGQEGRVQRQDQERDLWLNPRQKTA
jgi:DNA-binding PadR family transcriptional regulator